LDLDSLIASFSTASSYTVTRRQRSAVTFRRGIAQATIDSTLTITACVQPATGKDLLRLAEGRRTNETRAIFTTTRLFTGDQDAAYEADWVTIDGDPWEVQMVQDFVQAGGGVAYRCIVQAPTPESGS
jgi:hypothetical protein